MLINKKEMTEAHLKNYSELKEMLASDEKWQLALEFILQFEFEVAVLAFRATKYDEFFALLKELMPESEIENLES